MKNKKLIIPQKQYSIQPEVQMTPAEYKAARRARGTQQGVARMLGVDCRTIQRREAGDITISSEACRALLSLPVIGKSKTKNKA